MAERTCSIDGCTKPARTRGWCSAHYERYRVHGSTEMPQRKPRARRPDCKIDGCNAESQPSHGMCKRHYSAWYYRENRERLLAEQRAKYETVTHASDVDADAVRIARRERARAHYLKYRARQLAREAERYRNDPEVRRRKKDAARRSRELHRDELLARKRADYRARKAHYNAIGSAYYEAHRDEMRAANRRWKAEHPERASELARNAKGRRRARERGGRVTKTDLAAILAEHGMTCHICGDEIVDRTDLHFDHVIPLAKGGAHSPENIRPAHALCNRRKAARLTA